MPLVQSLRPQLQPFDSGKLAPRVANIILSAGETIDDDAAAGIIENAMAEDFDFVWIESQTKLDTAQLDYRGTIVELQADREEVLSNLPVSSAQCDIRTLDPHTEVVTFEKLMGFIAATRFGTDPHISPASFREHKRALLKGHIDTRHGVITVACAPEDPSRPIGYTCTSLSEQGAHVYDLCTDPDFRRSSIGRTLLRFSIEQYRVLHPDARRYMTRIYDDNIPCLRLFRSIGFADTGRLFHYYHCWPKARG